MTSLCESGMMRFSHELVCCSDQFATVSLCLLWSVPYSLEYARSTMKIVRPVHEELTDLCCSFSFLIISLRALYSCHSSFSFN